jgi:hypothetical protein
MKTRRALVLAAAFLAFSAEVSAQAQAWVGDRGIGEGIGIRAGDFELHPGVSGELGFDSNYFQRSSSVVEEAFVGGPAPALHLRIMPTFSLRTLEQRISEEDRASDHRMIALETTGRLSYNEFIGFRGEDAPLFDSVRNLQGALSATVDVARHASVSAQASGGYAYVFDPSNQGGYTSDFSRHLLDGGAMVKWKPGGGAFEWTMLRYGVRVTLFDVDAFDYNDNQTHNLTSIGTWKFLPKTAFVYDANFGVIVYRPLSPQNGGPWVNGRLGLSGLLTQRFGLLVMAGWATSFFWNRNLAVQNFDDFIVNAEARFYLRPQTEPLPAYATVPPPSLALGYNRGFQTGYLGDFFQLDRVYGQLSYLIGGRVLTKFEAGASFINYPDFLLQGTPQVGFGETRIDLLAFAEYRPSRTVGLNVAINYDANASQVLAAPSYVDDLSFSRFRFFLGARWFL